MGRLFWKFFFFTMLAQVIATLSVGGSFWLKELESRKRIGPIDLNPFTSTQIESAALTLQYGGVPALRQLLMQIDQRQQVLAVDDSGHDLLGRVVDPQILSEARAMLRVDMPRREIRQAVAVDGTHFLLFALATPPAEGNFDDPGAHPMPPPNGMEHGGPMNPLQPFLGVATAILASLIFAWLLARYFSTPIKSLRRAFDAIAGGDLNTRLGPEMGLRSDELADLGRDFDTMAERLRTLVDGQRRMLHDVSHELRSPLARLQAAIGLARQQPDKIEVTLTRIEREGARIEKLVSQLLTLSRLNAPGHRLAQDEIDFAELLGHVMDDARFEAQANGRTIEFAGNCSIFLQGDAELLLRAIENVVRNALKYSPPGATVEVEAKIDPAHNEIHLEVRDRGPGVPHEELPVIFEPFYRGAATVRNLDGHGLGLAIATRVVSNHGGRIVATNRDGGGLQVEISLPISAASF